MEEGRLYKRTDDIENLTIFGYDLSYVSLNSNWSPHYHRALEIIYILHGKVAVFLGKEKHVLQPGDFVVVDSMLIHEVVCKNKHSDGIIVEVSKKYMKKFIPDFELLYIECYSKETAEKNAAAEKKKTAENKASAESKISTGSKASAEIESSTQSNAPAESNASTENKSSTEIEDEKAEAIQHLKDILHSLALIYKEQKHGFMLRSNGLMMEILAILVERFSSQSHDVFPENLIAQMERLGSIIDYVEKNYQRPISLQEAADFTGLNREYFCRYFKKNVGYSFLDFLSNVRLNHVYKDLVLSTDPISEVLDRNGVTNQKLFYRKFKEKFGSTPTQVRKTLGAVDS